MIAITGLVIAAITEGKIGGDARDRRWQWHPEQGSKCWLVFLAVGCK